MITLDSDFLSDTLLGHGAYVKLKCFNQCLRDAILACVALKLHVRCWDSGF